MTDRYQHSAPRTPAPAPQGDPRYWQPALELATWATATADQANAGRFDRQIEAQVLRNLGHFGH
jgi:hypothetical protein